MTPEQASKLWPIIREYGYGKRIQKRLTKDSHWEKCTCPDFCGIPDNYRIAPEPVPPGDLTWEEAEKLHNDGVEVEVMHPSLAPPKNTFRTVFQWFLNATDKEKREASYRRKPAPKMVKLGPEDVRPGDVFSNQNWDEHSWAACIGAYAHNVIMACLNADSGTICRSYEKLMEEGWKISHDGGSTWQRCEKEEK